MYEELEPFILWLSYRCKAILWGCVVRFLFSFLFFLILWTVPFFYFIYIISFVDKFPIFNWYLKIGAESQPQVQPVFFGPVPSVFWIFLHSQLCSCTRQTNSGWERSELRTEEPCRTLHYRCVQWSQAARIRCPYSSCSLGDVARGISPSNQHLRAAFSVTSGILRAVSSRPSKCNELLCSGSKSQVHQCPGTFCLELWTCLCISAFGHVSQDETWFLFNCVTVCFPFWRDFKLQLGFHLNTLCLNLSGFFPPWHFLCLRFLASLQLLMYLQVCIISFSYVFSRQCICWMPCLVLKGCKLSFATCADLYMYLPQADTACNNPQVIPYVSAVRWAKVVFGLSQSNRDSVQLC